LRIKKEGSKFLEDLLPQALLKDDYLYYNRNYSSFGFYCNHFLMVFINRLGKGEPGWITDPIN